ncbi:MAG: hypothetical protein A2289_17595 [Deltaproteobacteria bacterium RIFOXYA12_FULL_58_15]|nr:MAG: hypothetical protein A2289_17595 [Deltaproteobacteria bacterium RIFOXYA12_FULL_58_15]
MPPRPGPGHGPREPLKKKSPTKSKRQVVEAPGIEGGRPIPVSTGFDLFRPDPSDNFGESSTSEGDPIPVSTILDPFQRNTVTFVTGVYPDLGTKKVVRLLRAVGLDLAVVPASRGASPDYLRMACVSASVSFRQQLQPEQLARAILSGAVPAGFGPHLRMIFEEAPQEVVLGAMTQLSGATRALTRVVESARRLAEQVGC